MTDVSWLAGEYPERKAAAEAQVTEWVSYTDQAYETEPLQRMRGRYAPAERAEDGADALYTYGLDDEGRAWVERRSVRFEGQFYECFRVLGPDGLPVELALYDDTPGKSPIRHQTFSYENGLLTETASRATGGCGRSRYFYDNGRLVRVEEESGESPERLRPLTRILVEYDETGEVRRLTAAPYDPETGLLKRATTLRRAWPADVDVEDVERAFLDEFVRILPAVVAADPPPVPPSCLWLNYSAGQLSQLPPWMLFPLDEGAAGIVEMMHDYVGHQIVLDADDHPRFTELAGLLDQMPLDGDRLHALMRRVARRLNDLDWAPYLQVADDFFVFACDMEEEALEENLRDVLDEERAKRILGHRG